MLIAVAGPQRAVPLLEWPIARERSEVPVAEVESVPAVLCMRGRQIHRIAVGKKHGAVERNALIGGAVRGSHHLHTRGRFEGDQLAGGGAIPVIHVVNRECVVGQRKPGPAAQQVPVHGRAPPGRPLPTVGVEDQGKLAVAAVSIPHGLMPVGHGNVEVVLALARSEHAVAALLEIA